MALYRLDVSEEIEAEVEEVLRVCIEERKEKKEFFYGRRTKKKIEKAYKVLMGKEFSDEMIKDAFSNAHDLVGALEYLCLTYSSRDLPSHFRAYAQKSETIFTEDEVKPQLTFIPASTPPATEIKMKEETPVIESTPVVQKPKKVETVQTEDKVNAKAWTLRYLEMQESGETPPEIKIRDLKEELEYTTQQLRGLKKSKKDEIRHWNAEIARLKKELDDLTPQTESAIVEEPLKVEVAPSQVMMDDSDPLDMLPMIDFDMSNIVLTIPKSVNSINVNSGKWTGKTPRIQLQEHCQKQKWPVPHYAPDSSRGKYNYKLTIKRGKLSPLHVTVPDLYSTIDVAKDAVATRCLYELQPNLPLHRGFPPYFRDMWLSWVKEVEDAAQQVLLESASANASIIDELFSLASDTFDVQDSMKSTIATTDIADSWDSDPDESWEDTHIEEDSKVETIRTVDEKQSSNYAGEFRERMQSKKYKALLPTRMSLPIAKYKADIIQEVEKSSVVLVSGETGSGKSTQVPQYVLENLLLNNEDGFIICTQPRRLAAIGVAERVAEELGENLGSGYVGYQIRLEQKKSSKCKLLFCTTGILLRLLQSDLTLAHVSHVVVDEIHERDVQCDVLLGLLRRLIVTRPSLKLILMSATLNAAMFQAYFQSCSLITVPGRLYPVETFYLEDVFERTKHIIHEGTKYCLDKSSETSSYNLQITGRGGSTSKQVLTWETSDTMKKYETEEVDGQYSNHTRAMMDKVNPTVINNELIEDLVCSIVHEQGREPGAILIFLSGRGEIRTLIDQLGANRSLGSKCIFLPLHASLSTTEQHSIFNHYPNLTKVIVSTNIAETSLTIDDVTVVIDAGRVKQMRHDTKTQTSTLSEVWISQANANQRAGRAGRVQSGQCFRLYPRDVYEGEMLPQPIAEIHRASLTGLTLQLHTLVPGKCDRFWKELLETPSEQAILDAETELTYLGAIDAGKLTPLGQHLAKLPLDVRLGKMLLFAAIFGCTRPISIVAAILESKSPFIAPFGKEKEAREKRQLFRCGDSDLLSDLSAFEAWERLPGNEGNSFCKKNFLHRPALIEIKKLATSFEKLLKDLNFLNDTKANKYAHDLGVVGAIVAAGLYPKVISFEIQPNNVIRFREKEKTVYIHPSSINYGIGSFSSSWLGYHHKLYTSRMYIPVSSIVTPLSIALFGGQISIKWETRSIVIDESYEIPCAGRTTMIILELRKRLSDLLQRKLDSQQDVQDFDDSFVDVIARMWSNELKNERE